MIQDAEPDIIDIIMLACKAGGLAADTALQIEDDIRAEYGGVRVRIPKRRKHLTPVQRQHAYQDGLTSMTTAEITAKHKIGRSALYALMKRGS